jgi:hypothetical protein
MSRQATRSPLRGILFSAAAIILTLTITSVGPSPAWAEVAANTPLSFGMSADEAAQVLGVTLVYVRGRPGNEMFLALPNVKGSALSDRRDGLYLQFRRGKLSGWKGDWGTNRPCCN